LKNKPASKTKTILFAALLAGTLDILAAILVYDIIMQRVTAIQILDGIAAGLFGKTVSGNETDMAIMGLLLHYFIAFCFAAAYFFAFPKISFLKKNAVISGLLYGIIVWVIMNRIVVPLSQASHGPFAWPAFLRGVTILMLCIGLPISIITARYYKDPAAVTGS
jgi:hypothetical protein